MSYPTSLSPRLEEGLRHTADRKSEFLRLYRPLPEAERYHRSLASERILLGGNRGGKSMSQWCEVASALTGIPITARSGAQIPSKWPKGPLIFWVIGYDEEHLAMPCYADLFLPNRYKVVQESDGTWRSWDPERDPDMEPNSRPLIPERFVSETVMEDPKKRVPHAVHFKAGHQLYFFSSLAEPRAGVAIDGVFIDDEIAHARHVTEWRARLLDRKGRFSWASIPSSRNDAQETIVERAIEQREWETPDTEVFELALSDNPYLDEEVKRKFRQGLTDDELQVRDLGQFNKDMVRMYPEFNRKLHCLPRMGSPHPTNALEQFLEGRGWDVPGEWTHYLILDPGHTKPAVLIAAVPPPDQFGDFLIGCNEVMLRKADADDIAQACVPKLINRYHYASIIDKRAGRKTPEGFSITIKQQYTRAFERAGISSHLNGPGFMDSSDDVLGGIGLVRQALRFDRPNAYPRLMFIRHLCPQTIRQLERYRKQVMKNADPEDKPAPRQKDDLADCVRYLVGYDPNYDPPKNLPTLGSPAYRFFQQMQAQHGRTAAADNRSVIMGMP